MYSEIVSVATCPGSTTPTFTFRKDYLISWTESVTAGDYTSGRSCKDSSIREASSHKGTLRSSAHCVFSKITQGEIVGWVSGQSTNMATCGTHSYNYGCTLTHA